MRRRQRDRRRLRVGRNSDAFGRHTFPSETREIAAGGAEHVVTVAAELPQGRSKSRSETPQNEKIEIRYLFWNRQQPESNPTISSPLSTTPASALLLALVLNCGCRILAPPERRTHFAMAHGPEVQNGSPQARTCVKIWLAERLRELRFATRRIVDALQKAARRQVRRRRRVASHPYGRSHGDQYRSSGGA
jgi:hypothetical protein